MPRIPVDHTELACELTGRGEPLVLVHGSWSDRHNWRTVAPALAERFHVVAYDRRGHGQSGRPGEPGSRRHQEDDLAGLIEALDCGPAHVAGTSFGASIALGLAARRPELVRSLVAHEPPLMSVVAHDPHAMRLLGEVQATVQSVLARVAAGQVEDGARQFVDEVALGPGAWDQLPEALRETMIHHAPAFVGEQGDANWASIDPAELSRIECPVLLTQGDQSPPWFPGIVAGLAEMIPTAKLLTYRDAGHAPHVSHPDDYLSAVRGFLTACTAQAQSSSAFVNVGLAIRKTPETMKANMASTPRMRVIALSNGSISTSAATRAPAVKAPSGIPFTAARSPRRWR
jgi:pimeloyl-ACP methyl ester carboxylesterase